MLCLYYNNASSTLAGPISNSATTVNLAAGTGAQFSPAPTTGQFFAATIVSQSNPATFEIVYVTNVTGDTLTIERAQEGTTALAWSAGDLFFNYFTAGSAAELIQEAELQVQPGNYVQGAGSASAITATLAPVPASYASISGSPIRIRIPATNTGAVTLNLNGLGAAAVKAQTGAALAAGQLVANTIAEFFYDATSGNFWLAGSAAGGISGATAGAYIFPASITVSAQGVVTAITAGTKPVHNTSGNDIQLAYIGGQVALTVDTTSFGNIITTTSTLGGVLTGTLPNPGMAASGVAAGTYYGPTIVLGADGRITTASNGITKNGFVNASPGTYSWTVPVGVFSAEVEMWGGGGGGGGSTNAPSGGVAGGGGGYIWAIVAVSPEQVISYTVGAGGLGGNNSNGGSGTTTSILGLAAGYGTGGQAGVSGFGTIGGSGGSTSVTGAIAADAINGSGGGLSGAIGTLNVYAGQGGCSYASGSGQLALVGYTTATAGLSGVTHGGGGGGGVNGGGGGNGANGAIRVSWGGI